MRNRIGTFDAKNAHIRNALMRNLAARASRSTEQALKAEKIPFRISFRQGDDK